MSLDSEVQESFDADHAARFATWFDAFVENVNQIIRGKDDVVRLVLQCLFAGGHVLIEDVPGVAKTTLAKAFAQSIAASFSRIQFTPDLLPSDVTGVQIYRPDQHEFEFRKGPIFANIVLADEINRASPKTQSALLEAMAEKQTTVDGETYRMADPFLVIATQNSVEMHGTYPLPEAQLDRFMIRIAIGYPSHKDEMQVVRDTMRRRTAEHLEAVLTAEHVQQMIDAAQGVFVAESLIDYMVTVGARTRDAPELRLGASSRAIAQLTQLTQARAASQGRHYAGIDDVKALVKPVFSHRLMLRPEAAIQGLTVEDLLDRILAEVPVPRERSAG